jgi:hypothetical protein
MEDQITLQWHKSSYSGNGGGDCVEVACNLSDVTVRDSKNPGGPRLNFTPADWQAFTRQVKATTA